MLQDLFPKDHKRYQSSRFAAELEAFAEWLAAQGHLRHPLRLHLHRVRNVLDGCDRFGPGGMFKEEDLRQAFIVQRSDTYLYVCTGRIFTRFLAAANRLVPVEHTDAPTLLRRRYHHYLAELRGFAKQSLNHHGATVADFLARGLSPDRGLSGLTAADVEAFVQLKSQENTRQSLQHIVAQLRAFLRYCGDRGEAPAGLDVIDTPRVYRGELPPRALDWNTVRRLLASIRRRSPRDWRDYAVLHLMACYGLRPCEVAALRLDAVDWEAGMLKVDQRKTRSNSRPTVGRPDLGSAAPLPAGCQSQQRLAATLSAHPQPDPCDEQSRNRRDLQVPSCPKLSAARRCVVLFATPRFRHAIAAPRCRHQGDR